MRGDANHQDVDPEHLQILSTCKHFAGYDIETNRSHNNITSHAGGVLSSSFQDMCAGGEGQVYNVFLQRRLYSCWCCECPLCYFSPHPCFEQPCIQWPIFTVPLVCSEWCSLMCQQQISKRPYSRPVGLGRIYRQRLRYAKACPSTERISNAYLSFSVSACLSVCLSVSHSLSPCLHVCLSVSHPLSPCLHVCLSVCLYLTPSFPPIPHFHCLLFLPLPIPPTSFPLPSFVPRLARWHEGAIGNIQTQHHYVNSPEDAVAVAVHGGTDLVRRAQPCTSLPCMSLQGSPPCQFRALFTPQHHRFVPR